MTRHMTDMKGLLILSFSFSLSFISASLQQLKSKCAASMKIPKLTLTLTRSSAPAKRLKHKSGMHGMGLSISQRGTTCWRLLWVWCKFLESNVEHGNNIEQNSECVHQSSHIFRIRLGAADRLASPVFEQEHGPKVRSTLKGPELHQWRLQHTLPSPRRWCTSVGLWVCK